MTKASIFIGDLYLNTNTMLLNLSNHPSFNWSNEQKDAAIRQFGGIVDLPFPMIDPDASLESVEELAEETYERIISMNLIDLSVHVMGELTFCYAFLKILELKGIAAYASTTHREVVVNESGVKTSVFRFFKFRPYF